MKDSNHCSSGVTLDSDGSQILDQAFYVEKTSAGWCLKIFISNVAAVVGSGSKNDLLARSRGFSTNEVDMFDRSVAVKSFSLFPGIRRRTIEITFHLDLNLNVIDFKIDRTIFKSSKQLYFSQVQKILEDKSHPDHSWWLNCLELAKSLKAIRFSEVAESSLSDNTNCPEQIVKDESTSLQVQYSDVADIPSEFAIILNFFLTNYVRDQGIDMIFLNLNRESLDSIRNENNRNAIETHPRNEVSSYSHVNRGHADLKLETYAHWTSPIRRYADLVNQRILNALITTKKIPYDVNDVELISSNLNCQASEFEKHKRCKREAFIKNAFTCCSRALDVDLKPGDFSILIELLACDEMKLNHEIEEFIKLKITEKNYHLIHLATILFDFKVVNARWKSIAICAFELASPSKAFTKLLFNYHPKNRDWSDYNIELKPFRGKLQVKASLSQNGLKVMTEFITSNDKMRATARAKLKLVSKLINFKSANHVTDQTQKPNSIDYWGKLKQFCVKNSFVEPIVSVSNKQEMGKSEFRCIITVVVSDQTYISLPRYGSRLYQAKNLAAEEIFCQLQVAYEVDSSFKCLGQVDPATKLNTWYQRQKGVSPPQHYFKESGNGKNLLFTCTTSIVINRRIYTASSKQRTKKLAKRVSAALLFSKIYNLKVS